MALDWSDYVKLALMSSVVTTITSGVIARWNEHRTHARDARHIALTAALALENYARAVDVVRRNVHRRGHRLEAIGPSGTIPPSKMKLPSLSYPDTIEWKWLKPDVAAKLRSFPGDVEGMSTSSESRSEEEAVRLCCETISEALELAELARRGHGVPEWEPNPMDRSMISGIHTDLADLKRRAEYAEARRKSAQKRAHLDD